MMARAVTIILGRGGNASAALKIPRACPVEARFFVQNAPRATRLSLRVQSRHSKISSCYVIQPSCGSRLPLAQLLPDSDPHHFHRSALVLALRPRDFEGIAGSSGNQMKVNMIDQLTCISAIILKDVQTGCTRRA